MAVMEYLAARAKGLLAVAMLAPIVALSADYAQAETVPRTYDGAGDAFRQGGKEVGEGFRGVGRGVKDTFTGRRSAEDYRQGKKIGTGVTDIGRGLAGGARATGREIKRGVTGGGDDAE